MAHERDDGSESLAFTEVGTSRRQRSTPICRSFESPGGSQWEEWTSADDAKDIVIERYPTSGRHPATIANFRSSARMAFRSGGVAGPTPRQRESWQQAAKSKSRLAAPPAAAHHSSPPPRPARSAWLSRHTAPAQHRAAGGCRSTGCHRARWRTRCAWPANLLQQTRSRRTGSVATR